MARVFPAPTAELLQIELPLNLLLVLRRVVIPPLADGAPEPDEIFRMF